MKPPMKLFLDTADVAVIKDMVPTGMVDGVTTNPSLIAKSGRNIAEVIADSWKRNLGVDAKLLNQEWKVYLDTQSNLQYDVSRSAWIGDYADPNTFLDMFLTGGENNKTGWGDEQYDLLIARASTEFDPAERMRILAEAE